MQDDEKKEVEKAGEELAAINDQVDQFIEKTKEDILKTDAKYMDAVLEFEDKIEEIAEEEAGREEE